MAAGCRLSDFIYFGSEKEHHGKQSTRKEIPAYYPWNLYGAR
jgi:hypothetical protein